MTPAGNCSKPQVNAKAVAAQLGESTAGKHKGLDSVSALHELGVEVLFYILSTEEAEAGGSEVQLSSSTW